MSYRPFRKFGRFMLAACAVSFGTATLGAQAPAAGTTGTAATSAAYSGPNPSRVDIFMGYSYFGPHGTLKPYGISYSSVDEGAVLSGAYYFNKYFGAEIEGFANPNGRNDGLYSGSLGPIVRAPMQNFTLFAHGLVGGVKMGGPNSEIPSTLAHNPYQW